MFSKAKKNSRQALANEKRLAPPSIISADMRLTGDVFSDGEVQIDGRVDGDVVCKTVTIGPTGAVTGEVRADNARLHGTMVGQLKAGSVYLAATARMTGDISHESLAIEPGAYVDGHCRHIEQPVQIEEEKNLMIANAKGAEADKPDLAAAAKENAVNDGSKAKDANAAVTPKPGNGAAKGDRTPQEAMKGALSGAT